MPRFELGDKVKDNVSGLEGIATGRLEYLNGCVQYGVSGAVGKDGKIPETVYIDHTQLELVEAKAVKVKAKDTGGANTIISSNQGPR